jgi:hypothetical protein
MSVRISGQNPDKTLGLSPDELSKSFPRLHPEKAYLFHFGEPAEIPNHRLTLFCGGRAHAPDQ